MSKEAIEALTNEINFIESEEFNESLILKDKNKKSEGADQINLIYLPRLKGLHEFAVSDKQNLFYFYYNFDMNGLQNTMMNNFLKKNKDVYCPKFLIDQKITKMQQVKNEDLEVLEKTHLKLKSLDNF